MKDTPNSSVVQSDSASLNGVSSLHEDDFVRFLTVKQGLEPTSVKNARIRFGVLKRYLLEKQVGITPQSIEQFLFELRDILSNNNSINTYLFMLKQLDYYALDRKLEWAGFSKGIKTLPKNKPKVDVLTWDEIEKILSTEIVYKPFRGMDCTRLNSIYKCMIRVLAETGCRYEECSSLRAKDYYRDSMKISLIDTKNNDSRWIFISPHLKEMIDPLTVGKKPDDLIFQSMMRKQVVPWTFIEDLRARALKVGITKRVYPHLFRHSFATALGKTVQTHEIKDLLGHKDIKSTDGYIHTDAERLQTVSYHHPSKMKYLSFEDKKKLVMDVLTPLLLAFGDSVQKKVSESGEVLNIILEK